MRRHAVLRALALAGALGAAVPDAAAQPRFEVGTSFASSVVTLQDDENVTFVGLPAAGFGILGHGVYGSVFLGDRFALEPQLALYWQSGEGYSEHILNVTGQFSWFPAGVGGRSPFAFLTAGILETSGDDYTPTSYGAGAGYRFPLGRLVLRVDGRYVHYTGEFPRQELDMLAFGFSIGGLFGER